MKIVEYRGWDNFDVEFQDEHKYVKKNVKEQAFKKGQVKNPYDRTVFGVGYLGVGKYRARKDKRHMYDTYNVWNGMLERCYYDAERHPAYYGICTVCDEWFNYQTFAKWYEENKYECEGRLHIDKDILHPGNKIYSPEHCILVPQYINTMFIGSQNNSGLPSTVRKTKTGRYSSAFRGKRLGTYDTLEEAFEIHARVKEQHIKKVATEHKDELPKHVYEAIMRYEVNLENDINYRP